MNIINPITPTGWNAEARRFAEQVKEALDIIGNRVDKLNKQGKQEGITMKQVLDTVYPVGSVYVSFDSVSPAEKFGGEWSAIQGKFLLSADANHAAGSTGGEETHTLTVDEMPSHNHNEPGVGDVFSGAQSWGHNYVYNKAYEYSLTTSSTGGGQAHNNMPPYVSVYMWQRTA